MAIEKYNNALQSGIRNTAKQINNLIDKNTNNDLPLMTNQHIEDIHPIIRSLALSIQTGRYNCPQEAIHSILLKQTNNNFDIENLRELFNAKWH